MAINILKQQKNLIKNSNHPHIQKLMLDRKKSISILKTTIQKRFFNRFEENKWTQRLKKNDEYIEDSHIIKT